MTPFRRIPIRVVSQGLSQALSSSQRLAMPLALAWLLVLAASPAAEAARKAPNRSGSVVIDVEAVDPAFVAMLGRAVPEATAIDLASRLRVVAVDGSDVALPKGLAASGPATPARFEGSGLSLKIRVASYGDLRVEDARVVLEPSADGRSCRFEISGKPFGEASTMQASGTVTWNTGPLGGHQLDAKLDLDGAPVEAVRAVLPKRLDPSIHGVLALHLKGTGVVGEKTTEDAPATPWRGELEASTDWTVVGRSGPMTVTSAFALDDRMVRLTGGHVKWQDFDLPLQGWIDPAPWGRFDLVATFADVDTKKVAEQWNVPAEWTPASLLSGRVAWKGEPGESTLRYEATAPVLDLPAWGGWPVHLEAAQLSGGILEVNADVNASVSYKTWRLGDLELPPVFVGLQWFRGTFSAMTSKTDLWKGSSNASLSYKPAEHPAFSMTGVLLSMDAAPMLGALAAPLRLDVDGRSSMTWTFGQDAERRPKWTVRGSLMAGRLGNVDLVARVLESLGAADPSLQSPDAAALVPRPKAGAGLRVDRLFVEVEKKSGVFELGGLILDSGDFRFEGDGRWTPADGLAVDGTLVLPEAVATKLVAAAPWAAALRAPGGVMVVPVSLRGTTEAPQVALDPAYAALLGRARSGEAITAPLPKAVRHVGADNLPAIPGDPSQTVYQ